MKKLLAISMMLLLIMGVGWASTSTTVSLTNHTSDYTSVVLNYSINDTTNIVKVYLYWNGALKDSVGSLKDSLFTVTGLMNGTTYPYYFSVMDTTGNDTTVIRNPSDGSIATTDLEQTLTIPDSTVGLEGFTVYWDSVGSDTGVCKVYLYVYNVEDSLWAAGLKDSIVVTAALYDTLFAVTGLQEGETYYVGTVALDSAVTDTSAIYSVTTTDLTGTMTISLSGVDLTITVTPNASTDFNGVDSINLFEGTSAAITARVTGQAIAETLTITWDTTVVNPLNSDSVFFYWGELADSISGYKAAFATDTSTGDSASASFIKTGLRSNTKYYYSAVVCSADVYDSIAIDSVTTTSSFVGVFSRTGKYRYGHYFYWAQIFDSIYCDSVAMDSIEIPEIREYALAQPGVEVYTLTWDNPSDLTNKFIDIDVGDDQTVYYEWKYSGATATAADTFKLFVYDMTWITAAAYDSSAKQNADTGTVAVDSVFSIPNTAIGTLRFQAVERDSVASGTIDANIGRKRIYLHVTRRPR